MLKTSKRTMPLRVAAMLVAGVNVCSAPAAAQCTVNEIIARMVTPIDDGGTLPTHTTGELAPAGEATDIPEASDTGFTPEIDDAQRQVLRQVGQSCSWTSDVSNCTFRGVAKMALRGWDAAYIYDYCSD